MNPTAGILMGSVGTALLFITMLTFIDEDVPKRRKQHALIADILFVLLGWLVFPWVGLALEKVWYLNMSYVNNHSPNMEVIPPARIKVQAPVQVEKLP